MRDFVKTANGKYVAIDSRYTYDHGYESMVFESDFENEIVNWSELQTEWYNDLSEMEEGHKKLVNGRKENYKRVPLRDSFSIFRISHKFARLTIKICTYLVNRISTK